MAEREFKIAIRANANGVSQTIDGVGEQLKKLKKITGEESTAGGLLKLVTGAGAAAAVGLGARIFGDSIEKAADLKRQFDAGGISASQMVNNLGRALPVLGDVFRAGNALNSILSQDARAAAQITAEAVNINAAVKTGQNLLQLRIDRHKEEAKTLREILDLNERIGKQGTQLARVQLEQDTRKQLSAIDAEVEAKRAKVEETARAGAEGKTLDQLRKDAEKAAADLGDAQAALKRIESRGGGEKLTEGSAFVVAVREAQARFDRANSLVGGLERQRAKDLRDVEQAAADKRAAVLVQQQLKEQEIIADEQRQFRERMHETMARNLKAAQAVAELQEQQAEELRKALSDFGGKLAGGVGAIGGLFGNLADVDTDAQRKKLRGGAGRLNDEIARAIATGRLPPGSLAGGREVGIFPDAAKATRDFFPSGTLGALAGQLGFDVGAAGRRAASFFGGLAGGGGGASSQADGGVLDIFGRIAQSLTGGSSPAWVKEIVGLLKDIRRQGERPIERIFSGTYSGT